jgi:hypothetical protein
VGLPPPPPVSVPPRPSRVRILIRPRLPVLALLLLAPTIPELLTGSTPITELVYDPFGFAIGFAGIVGLYGCGALLIREFAVYFRKGWATILLLGAAYGIAEEGLAVHTFFEPAGQPPVGAFGWYGHAFGVNWLWALGLSAFHAVYSIALPILLTYLFFPEVRNERWLSRGAIVLVAGIYLFVVGLFSVVVGHGPSPGILGLFLLIEAALIYLAWRAPADLLRLTRTTSRLGPWGIALAGSLFFDAWALTEFFSGLGGRVPAVVAAAILVTVSLCAILLVLRRVGTEGLERSEFYFATGMLGILFAWDCLIEFAIPGILLVSAAFAYLLYRLHRRLKARAPLEVPAGARGAPIA